MASDGHSTPVVRRPTFRVALRVGLVLLVVNGCGAAVARAQGPVPVPPALESPGGLARLALPALAESRAASASGTGGDLVPAAATEADAARAAAGPVAVPPALRRPGSLVPLYLSYGALQVLDVTSTRRAIEAGATEANPLLQGVAGNTGATLAVKAGTTAATVFLVERLWRRNRPAAIVLMAALNGAYAAVVAHNYRQAR